MQAIQVSYRPATASRGSRLLAKCEAGNVSIAYPYGLKDEAAARKAVDALCAKIDAPMVARHGPQAAQWVPTQWAGGQLGNGNFVFCPLT